MPINFNFLIVYNFNFETTLYPYRQCRMIDFMKDLHGIPLTSNSFILSVAASDTQTAEKAILDAMVHYTEIDLNANGDRNTVLIAPIDAGNIMLYDTIGSKDLFTKLIKNGLKLMSDQ